MVHIDPKDEIKRIEEFLRGILQKNSFKHVVVAVSGGIDSGVSLTLSVQALGATNIYPVLLPYGPLNTQGVLDAMELITWLHIPLTNIIRIDIKDDVDRICGKNGVMGDQVRRGNIMARVRMVYVYDMAKKKSALVVGTENKTEHLLGYFTRFGDGASDIEPIVHLYKTNVYEVAKELHIPESIIKKAPTAGLWPGQTDEQEFGFSYKEADNVLSQLLDEHKTKNDIVVSGIHESVVQAIVNRMERNMFKQETPYRVRALE